MVMVMAMVMLVLILVPCLATTNFAEHRQLHLKIHTQTLFTNTATAAANVPADKLVHSTLFVHTLLLGPHGGSLVGMTTLHYHTIPSAT